MYLRNSGKFDFSKRALTVGSVHLLHCYFGSKSIYISFAKLVAAPLGIIGYVDSEKYKPSKNAKQCKRSRVVPFEKGIYPFPSTQLHN